MQIGNLEFNEERFAIRKYKKNEWDRGEWYTGVEKIKITTAEVMRMTVAENKTLDLNIKHFGNLKEWLELIEQKCGVNESVKKLRDEIMTYKKPHETHVYINCENEKPVYVGIQHEAKQKKFYWGSSKTYKAPKGTKKYIVADNLDHKQASEIEEYLIRTLKKKYNLKNNTPGNENIREELREKIIREGHEIYYRE